MPVWILRLIWLPASNLSTIWRQLLWRVLIPVRVRALVSRRVRAMFYRRIHSAPALRQGSPLRAPRQHRVLGCLEIGSPMKKAPLVASQVLVS
jgi:hypothetical protein